LIFSETHNLHTILHNILHKFECNLIMLCKNLTCKKSKVNIFQKPKALSSYF